MTSGRATQWHNSNYMALNIKWLDILLASIIPPQMVIDQTSLDLPHGEVLIHFSCRHQNQKHNSRCCGVLQLRPLRRHIPSIHYHFVSCFVKQVLQSLYSLFSLFPLFNPQSPILFHSSCPISFLPITQC